MASEVATATPAVDAFQAIDISAAATVARIPGSATHVGADGTTGQTTAASISYRHYA